MSFLAAQSGGRIWNAAGGAFGAPSDIRSPDPRFTLSRAPAFANRPSSLVCRSDDALVAGAGLQVVAPASFLLNLPSPVIGAKALGVKQVVFQNLLPTVPDYQRWFLYQIRIDSLGVTRNYVFRYLQALVDPLPICASVSEFATYLNQSAVFAREVPPGQKISLEWYYAALGSGTISPDEIPVFAADVAGQKIAMELPVASGAPYSATDEMILPGLDTIKALMAPSAVVVTNGTARYDLVLNALMGQPIQDEAWPYRAQRSPSAALLLPLFANISGTQTIYVTSSITSNGAKTVSNTQRSIIATVPNRGPPNELVAWEPAFIHWIWSLSAESIMQVTIDLLDENLQPIVLPYNSLTEVDIGFLYEDSSL